MSDELGDLLCSKGADMVGVADLRSIAPDIRYDLPFGISIAVALNPKIVSGILNGPTKEYHAEYEQFWQKTLEEWEIPDKRMFGRKEKSL